LCETVLARQFHGLGGVPNDERRRVLFVVGVRGHDKRPGEAVRMPAAPGMLDRGLGKPLPGFGEPHQRAYLAVIGTADDARMLAVDRERGVWNLIGECHTPSEDRARFFEFARNEQ